jgi:3-phosphoshikimate 1-carboxyvinyltransferase
MKIEPRLPLTSHVSVPGSKSFSHRFLAAAALSDGNCIIENCLISEDTLLTMGALRQMGVSIHAEGTRIEIKGKNGRFSACQQPLFLGNSGTSLRFVCGLAALGEGSYTITGTDRMQERPIQDLLDGLVKIRVSAQSVHNNGCPPVTIQGGKKIGGVTELRCGKSSQYLSAMLLIAPCTQKGIDIQVTEGPVSRPYVDMTRDVMQQFGIRMEQTEYDKFSVPGCQTYRNGVYTVEPDCSQAGYFWAAAAVTGGDVLVKGTRLDMRQGDVGMVRLLESMGCRVVEERDGVRVTGSNLYAMEADMSDMPDMVPTIAVVAAFAEGKTLIKNVSHLKIKESNRLEAVVRELNKMDINALATDDGLVVEGGKPRGAVIDTYNDHRIAMSFAVAGLAVPGMEIRNPGCVAKSFPDFWEVLGTL